MVNFYTNAKIDHVNWVVSTFIQRVWTVNWIHKKSDISYSVGSSKGPFFFIKDEKLHLKFFFGSPTNQVSIKTVFSGNSSSSSTDFYLNAYIIIICLCTTFKIGHVPADNMVTSMQCCIISLRASAIPFFKTNILITPC